MLSQEEIKNYLREHPNSTARDMTDYYGAYEWEINQTRSTIYNKCRSMEKYNIVRGTEIDGIIYWSVEE